MNTKTPLNTGVFKGVVRGILGHLGCAGIGA